MQNSGSRRSSREIALQVLYQFEYSRQIEKAELEQIIPGWPESDSTASFSEILWGGVKKNMAAIDKLISSHSSNWSIYRISLIDKNILRIAIFELEYLDIPPKVTINEAIEVAKKFGDEKTPSFINGILDSILQSSPDCP